MVPLLWHPTFTPDPEQQNDVSTHGVPHGLLPNLMVDLPMMITTWDEQLRGTTFREDRPINSQHF